MAGSVTVLLIAALSLNATVKFKKDSKPAPLSVIDQLLASRPPADDPGLPSPGSTYSGTGSLSDLSADFRARHTGDLLTIVVADSASAISTGDTTTKRQSSGTGSITALAGVTKATGPLANMATLTGNQQLASTGTTDRITTLTMTLSVRVLMVLQNGDLVVEGNKLISVNSEKQSVRLRGIVRQTDLGPLNSVSSNQIAELEITVNGRGVVNDAIRRPNILYRLLLGILPY
jgi:flagellar L-ring protein precursor FlgH